MNVKEFISSGIIESYLLGTASTEEIDLLNDMKKRFPEVVEEINKVEELLIETAEYGQPALKNQLKEKILSSIQTSPNGKSNTNNAVELPSSNKKIQLYKYSMAAAIGLLIISGLMNIWLFSGRQKSNEQITKMTSEKETLMSEMDAQKLSMQEMNGQLAMFTDPDSKPVMLKGMTISPDAQAKVFWNSSSNDVYLMVDKLPAPPADKQYQLWAIVDGKPVDAGVFDLSDQLKMQKMKSISSAQAFAVTLENKGGSQSPTMEAMYLMGEV